jgi:hypothetical protein
VLDYLISKDEEDNDSDYHNTIRTLIERSIQTVDDRQYTPEEIAMAMEAINSKKGHGEEGITNDILHSAYKQFPNLINTLYNECLREECFPKRWKSVKLIPITKPVREDKTDPSKFRTICLINFDGKVLEKLLTELCTMYTQTISWTTINLDSPLRKAQQTRQ